MNTNLSEEFFWLAMTLLITALFWVPYILNRLREQGVGRALWDPQGHTAAQALWAQRMMKAHENAVENLVIFAPLVLMLQIQGVSNELTGMACMVYFFARATHYVVFTLGVPLLRVLTFSVGVGAQMVLLATLCGWT